MDFTFRNSVIAVGFCVLLSACAAPGDKRERVAQESASEVDGWLEAQGNPTLLRHLPEAAEAHVFSPAAEEQARLLRSKGLESTESISSGAPKARRRLEPELASMFDLVVLPAKSHDEMRVHSLPVGAGSCHLVECPGGFDDFMLIDCGSTEAEIASFGAQDAATYVNQIVAGHTVAVVVSHADKDHYSHIPTVLSPAQVSTLWLGGEIASYPASFLRWVNLVRDAGSPNDPIVFEELPVNWHNDGQSVDRLACGTALTYVLGVNNGTSKNDHSLMLSIDHGDFRVLFAGDATGKSQDAAIANYPDGLLWSPVVMASHHGASSVRSNNARWIANVEPQFVVYSAGESHAHPRCSVVDNYRAAGTLRSVESHLFRCGDPQGYRPTERSRLAEYNTYSSGVVVITSDAGMSDPKVQCLPGPC